MLSSRAALLRARPLIAVARWSPRVLQIANGRSLSQAPLISPTRNFSVSQYHQANETNENHSSNVSIHDRTYLVAATTTREDIHVKPGTEFQYIKVPHNLIPQGWTNDPYELEEYLALDLDKDYTSFPSSYTPVLLYTEHDKWWAYLVRAGLETYLYTCFSQLFRLKTPVGLTKILKCMREPNGSEMFAEGEMPEDSNFLKHPELDWHLIGEDECKKVKKAPATYNNMYEEEFRRRSHERAIVKCTREDYANWVGQVVESAAEDRWETVKGMLQQKDHPLLGTGWDGGAAMKTAWKNYTELWVAMEKAKAGKEHDRLVAEAQAAGRMQRRSEVLAD